MLSRGRDQVITNCTRGGYGRVSYAPLLQRALTYVANYNGYAIQGKPS